jgi:OPA family glycerol-3-phosphate transporter-like MFS transporter
MSVVEAASAAGPVEHPPGFRQRRAQNWVFLGLMYGFFYMSRYNLAAVQQALSEAFGWNHTQYASIAGTGVLIYGCSVFLNGPLADKIGGKRAILIGSAGAAFFNLLFGFTHLYLAKNAVVVNGTVTAPAVLARHMTTTSIISTMAVLWGCNHYFQSFGALSIVKINASWFHVRERGKFAGIFGIMIQSGRWFAFYGAPLILRKLPWWWAFWIPAAILTVMFVVNYLSVASTPADVGYDFHTADESREEAAQKATLGFVLRKVFASPAMWLIAFSSMCIGMVRNAIDQFWTGYYSSVFHVTSAETTKHLSYNVISYGTPVAAIMGGIAAGNLSDRVFGSRRAPVIFFAFIGMGLTLLLLQSGLHSEWPGAAMLLLIAFFISSAHSLVGGAASMDFGGKKAVATAAGLFDGAQYLAGAIITFSLGPLLDSYKVAKQPGVEYDVWPLAPLPFAVIGAILIARLWNVVPGRAAVQTQGEAQARALASVHKVERVVLGAWGLVAGVVSVLTIILPQVVARELYGHPLAGAPLLWSQLLGGARIALAIVALSAAMTPRPPKALVRALIIGLIASIAGPMFSTMTGSVALAELQPLKLGLFIDGVFCALLLTTSVLRANLNERA